MCTEVNSEIKTVPDVISSQIQAQRQSSQTEIMIVNQEIDELKNTLSTRKTSDSSVPGDISAHNSNVRRLDAEREIQKQEATLRTAAAVTMRV
jgi:septal ring factor EnvC (AmiA/AmiB activator)